MCLILDANEASRFVAERETSFAPVYKWMRVSDGRLVIGGENERELRKVGEAVKLLKSWSARGKVIRANQALVDAETVRLKKGGALASDDPHMIALAVVSHARIMCTKDRALIRDFAALSPSGAIFRGPEDSRLLRHHKRCAPKSRK